MKYLFTFLLFSNLSFAEVNVRAEVEKYFNLKDFDSVNQAQDLSVDNFSFYRIKLSNSKNQDQIQIDVFSSQESEAENNKKISLQYKRLRTLFNPNFTPYSEGVSKKSTCVNESKIVSTKVKYKDQSVEVFDAPVGKGFVFGECDPNKIVATGRFFTFINKEAKKIIEVRFFSKKLTPPSLVFLK